MNGYATENWVSTGFLALSGGTLTGDLKIIQDPSATTPVEKNVSELLRHLSLITENNVTYLIADIPLGSSSSVFAGGVGSGGSGGGGSIATLSDVTLTSIAGGDALVYDATSSHWKNKAFALANLNDFSGTPTNGQTIVYDSGTGKWIPANASAGSVTSVGISMPTGFSVSGSPVTGSGTLTVTFASGYSLFTSSLLNGYATQQWVNNKGYLTSSSLNGYATETWVTNKNYLTSSSLNGYATETWVTNKGYLDSVPAATDSAYGGFKTGYSESGKNYAVQLSSGKAYVNVPWTDTVYTHPTGGANKTISAANGKVLSAITVDSLGHVTSVDSKTLASADIPDLSGTYLPLTGGTLTGDLRLKNSGSYGLTLYFGDSSYAYITEDTDDHFTMYGRKGITMLTSSSSYSFVIGSSSAAAPVTIYGNTTAYGNITMGAQTDTSSCKTLTLYGRTSSSYPAITVYGVASSSTRYSTSVYRDATYLQITSGVYVSGNFVATGNVTSGNASDRRLKRDIRDITLDDAERMLSALHPVYFCWNDDAERLSEGELSGIARGFIADEFLKQMPNAGRKIWGDYDALYYEQAIPYLVAGWKQQNLLMRILESEIKTLKEDNEILRRRLRSNNVIQ